MALKRKFNLKNLGNWVPRKKEKTDGKKAGKENVCISKTPSVYLSGLQRNIVDIVQFLPISWLNLTRNKDFDLDTSSMIYIICNYLYNATNVTV